MLGIEDAVRIGGEAPGVLIGLADNKDTGAKTRPGRIGDVEPQFTLIGLRQGRR